MIAEKEKETSNVQSAAKKFMPWLQVILTILLVGWGLWYITKEITLSEIGNALALAKPGYIVLGLLVILVTMVVKTWRWRLLYYPRQDMPPFKALFWALSLGQFVNTAVPFVRLGEIARVYALDQQFRTSKVRSLGTLVVEKTLDLIMLVLTVGVLLPVIVLPDFISDPSLTLGIISLGAFLALYLLAYQTKLVIWLLKQVASRLPTTIEQRVIRLGVSGLEGLSALRDRRIILALLGTSILVAILSVLTPYVLFPAFNLPLGLVDAALIHFMVSLAIAPPSTPGKIVVFDGAVAFVLLGFGLKNEAVIVSYAVIFHLVVVLPQIVLGGIAASRTNWQWRRSVSHHEEHI